MFGRETTNWLGKRVTLFPLTMKDPFGDGDTLALRVRGSPDIDKPMTAEVKRGRKTLKISVRPTGKGAAKPNGKPTPPRPSEPSDEEKAAIAAAERAQSESDGFPS